MQRLQATLTLMLDADLAALTSSAAMYLAWTDAFEAALAGRLDIERHRIHVTSVAAGSVLVFLEILPSTDPNATTARDAVDVLYTINNEPGGLVLLGSTVQAIATIALPPVSTAPPPPNTLVPQLPDDDGGGMVTAVIIVCILAAVIIVTVIYHVYCKKHADLLPAAPKDTEDPEKAPMAKPMASSAQPAASPAPAVVLALAPAPAPTLAPYVDPYAKFRTAPAPAPAYDTLVDPPARESTGLLPREQPQAAPARQPASAPYARPARQPTADELILPRDHTPFKAPKAGGAAAAAALFGPPRPGAQVPIELETSAMYCLPRVVIEHIYE